MSDKKELKNIEDQIKQVENLEKLVEEKITELMPNEAPQKEPLPAPDLVHRGSIEYTIEWRGKMAYINVTNPLTEEHRLLMMYVIHEDLQGIANRIKNKVDNMHKVFNNEHKANIFKARFVIGGYLNNFLDFVYKKNNAEPKAETPQTESTQKEVNL